MAGLERDFEELFTQSITIYKQARNVDGSPQVNQYGEIVYSVVPAQFPAMVVRATKMIRTKDNAVKVSNAQVYLSGDYGIQPADQIVLPDGTKPGILHIGAWDDPRGPYCEVIYT